METRAGWILPLVLLAACSDDAAPATKTNGPLPEEQTLSFRACQTDDDCVFATNGCCDCANGGEEIAVAESYLADFRAQFDCEGTACTEMARNPPCGCGVTSCVDGICEYTMDGMACSTTGIECGADLGLTEADAIEADGMGFDREWTAGDEAGRFTLTWEGLCGDECNETREIVFGDDGLPCPSLISARHTTSECAGGGDCIETTEWALDGTLRIQDWQIAAGPVSGRLEGALSFTFYWSI